MSSRIKSPAATLEGLLPSPMLSHVWRARLLPCVLASLAFLAPASMLTGCVGSHALAVRHTDGLAPAIQWFGPQDATDTVALQAWRTSVGPPVHVSGSRQSASSVDSLTIVSWNTALGAGDVARLVAELQRRSPAAPIVLLLQEVYRGGPEVPAQLPRTAAFASRLKGIRADGRRDDVQTLAAVLGMSAYYVPSMRNGAPLASDEDRGNAILSTLPLSQLTAFELPFERQRRVAVGATVAGDSPRGEPWRLRVVSAHLDNMAGAKRLWIASELGRVRQTRALMHQLNDGSPVVVGGDFNTWFGFGDQAFRDAARIFPNTPLTDRRPTFRGWLRLDHVFFQLPGGWTGSFRRGEDTYGSDHYPLIASIRLPA